MGTYIAGIIAGTPVDTRMGAEFAAKLGWRCIEFAVSAIAFLCAFRMCGSVWFNLSRRQHAGWDNPDGVLHEDFPLTEKLLCRF